MLSSSQARTLATALIDRLGSVGLATAIWRAQEAERRGALIEMNDWRRIAEQALRRLAATDPGFAVERDVRAQRLH
jgi:hypothetical protein